MELYNLIQFGGSIGFMGDATTLAEDMGEVGPTLLTEDFSLEAGTITQTLKLKTHRVLGHFQNQLEDLYN